MTWPPFVPRTLVSIPAILQAVVPNTGKLRCTWTIYNQLGNVVNQGENTLTVSAAPAKVNLGINDRLTAADSCAPKARGRAFLTVKHTPVRPSPQPVTSAPFPGGRYRRCSHNATVPADVRLRII